MAESPPQPFFNKGLVLKADPAQLGPGEYYALDNVTSIQEGALAARTGHQRLTPASQPSPMHSLSKLNTGHTDAPGDLNPRYIGAGALIVRTGAAYAYTQVYSGLTSGLRWSAEQYNAGTAGTPALYIASRNAALRDNGSYATLQQWGIDPPPVPVLGPAKIR